ncbi:MULTISPECIES: LysR family transcriptional regulator [Sphingobium]|uniref:LysR family transcriptional regulator n=1 Tax=Sphingobium limneticum TaxID=1007511 RepID=A0A5J5IA99_9SPHN|nr:MULTISPECIES: LysR family transcriptional regulator [Sphingobium]KAA9020189.1 LysR family transcriptional regulator [Sphingobium limneticum]KAA9021331.1 LysR family transcriptional regulator [Sphingobium limneticum]KAA9033693.1 LysR family transcriptional regulator [Sphingobium limneticum]
MTLSMLLQTRSVSRSAQRLGLSQPTVSRALGQLRQLLADPLLVRSGGGMTLTQRGEALAQPLEAWLAMSSALLEPVSFDPAVLDRNFRVAATDYGVLSVVSPALPAIGAAAPNCGIDVSAFSDDMFKKLVSGELDLIIYGFEPDLSLTHARHLFRETQSLIVRRDHPIAAGGSDAPVSLDTYLGWPHVAVTIGDPDVDHVQSCLGDRVSERQLVARLPYFYAAPDLIGATDAILTMPTRAAGRFACSHGFACLPSPTEIKGFDYWVLWHERSARDPATLWLIDQLAAAV